MCGIHGFVWKDEEAARRMVAIAHHRGPDGSGVWSDRHVTLGHNLLAIADDAALSAQPWHHAGCVLTYNGEIYNYRDLRKTLSHTCQTDSDTEVLAAGLREHGPDFLHRVDGMFALAWYDPAAGTLLLARDSNGARPFYYGYHGGRLAFSSEIRSLLTLGFPRRVSKAAFRHYYHAGLVAGGLTMFEGIHKLIPGQVSTISLASGDWTTFNLNDRYIEPYAGDPAALPGLLRERLRDAVTLTMTGRRKIGLFLSGGMDSGAILYELCQSKKRPRTFSSRFVLPHDRCTHNHDANLASELAKKYKTKHRESLIDQEAWLASLEKAVEALEEPRQGKSYPAYYACNQRLKDFGITVTLSGDGGDELLRGYKHQQYTPFRKRLESLRHGHRSLRNPDLDLSIEAQVAYLDAWVPKGGLTGDPLNDFMYTECLHTLSEDFLVRNDKLGSAFSMEARFPMMCNVFRDFCRSIPGKMKWGKYLESSNSWAVNNKTLLRKAYNAKLPLNITSKPKTGWRAPTDDWIIGITTNPAPEGPIREYIRETLRDPVIRDLFELTDDIINNQYLNNHDFGAPPKQGSGKPSVGVGMTSQKELFSVLMFAVWYKVFNMQLW